MRGEGDAFLCISFLYKMILKTALNPFIPKIERKHLLFLVLGFLPKTLQINFFRPFL